MIKQTSQNIIKGLEKTKEYSLFLPTKYDNICLLHFLYWNNPTKEVGDERAWMNRPSDKEDWIEERINEVKTGYLTLGDNLCEESPNFYFDFDLKNKKIPEHILLAIYGGTPLWKGLKKKDRKFFYKNERLNLEKAIKMLKWKINYDESIKRIKEMDKPFVFSRAIHEEYQKIKPYLTLNDLLKNERK